MASITDSKYPIGTKVILSKCSKEMGKYFNVGDVFEKVKQQDFKYHFVAGMGNDEVFLENNNIIIKISGNSGTISAFFKHHSKTSRSDTNLLTETKEIISLITIKNNYSISDEHKLKKKLDTKHLEVYSDEYFDSAIKQNKILRTKGFRLDDSYIDSINRGSKIIYHCERQKGNHTDELYKKACKLSGLLPDNWNPADIWFISESILSDFKRKIKSFDNINSLNDYIYNCMKDKTIIPISLKHISKNKQANFKLMDDSFSCNMDLNIKEIGLNFKTFKNALIKTKSGFNIRVGFKNTNSLSTVFEGNMEGAVSNIGAIDKKRLTEKVKKLTGYDLKNTKFDEKYIVSLINILYNKINIKNGLKSAKLEDMISNYLNLSDKEKQNASIVIYSCWLVCVEALEEDKEFMKYMYLSSYKISENSCSYFLIN